MIVGAIPVVRAAGVCKPDLIAEIELQASPDGTVYMPATVNGHDVYFALDIASGPPMVFDSALQEMGLTARNRSGGADLTWGGRPITRYAKLDDLQVGKLRLLSRNALIISAQPGFASTAIAGKPLVGVMGSSLIRNVDAELFLAQRKLRMFTPIGCRNGTPVYWGGAAAALPMHWDAAGMPVFILQLNGRRIETSLLAGNGISTIDTNAAREFFGISDTGNAGQALRPMSLTGSGIDIRDAPVGLRAGGCKLTRSTPIYGAIGYASCVNTVPFNLGADLLRRLRIYISNKQETVFVSTVGQAGPDAESAHSIAPTQ